VVLLASFVGAVLAIISCPCSCAPRFCTPMSVSGLSFILERGLFMHKPQLILISQSAHVFFENTLKSPCQWAAGCGGRVPGDKRQGTEL
jgi:hypothetical protein